MVETRSHSPLQALIDYEFGKGTSALVEFTINRNNDILRQGPFDPEKFKDLELASRLFLGKTILSESEIEVVTSHVKKTYRDYMQKNDSRDLFYALLSGFDYFLLTGLAIDTQDILNKVNENSDEHIRTRFVDLFVEDLAAVKGNLDSFYLDNIDEIVDLGLGIRIVDSKHLSLVKDRILDALLKYVDLKKPSIGLRGTESLTYLKVMSTILYLESVAIRYSEQGKTKLITKEHIFS